MTWITKFKGFFAEVREEILKCTRPTRAELVESSWVVVGTMLILGFFIFTSDYVITKILGLLLGTRI